MITKETSSNKIEYQKLYDKVNYVINSGYAKAYKKALEVLPSFTADQTYKVTTIDDYFSILKPLMEIVQFAMANPNMENGGYDKTIFNDKLFIIPFGENDFAIDANTRKIGIPQEFSRNGVGVEGDHFVESLYFTIDRYFDTIDFAQSEVKAIVEWINANGEKCYSPAWTKVLDDDNKKLIIGWMLTDKATKKAGVVKFSIRLYTLQDGKLESSFATLVTNVVINPSMNFDLEAVGQDKIEPEYKSLDEIHTEVFKRLRSSPAVNKTEKDVEKPEYVIRYAQLKNGKIADKGNFDIADANAGDTYYVWAKSNSGFISYDWSLVKDGKPFQDTNPTYVPTSLWDSDMEYYIKNADKEYTLAENVTESMVTSGDYYVIMGVGQLPADGDVTGEYCCIAKNSQYGYIRPSSLTEMNSWSEEINKIGKITIKGPEDFTFALSNSETQVVGTVLNIVNENGKDGNTASSYQWKYKTFADGAEYVDKGTEFNQLTDAEGYWQATVLHTKNGATKSKTTEEDVIIYQPVAMPVADEHNETRVNMNPQDKKDVEWRFTISGDYNQYSYQWYKVNDAGTLDALTNSQGVMTIKNGAIVATLKKIDLAEINSIAKFKLAITGKKAIPGATQEVGVISWDGDKFKTLTIDFATVGG